MLSMAKVKRMYERFRRRYYAGFDMPSADDIRWQWWEHPEDLGATLYDTDEKPVEREYTIRLHPILRRLPRLMSVILLHEMSHVANPRPHHGRAWDREADRLGALGAMREFF